MTAKEAQEGPQEPRTAPEGTRGHPGSARATEAPTASRAEAEVWHLQDALVKGAKREFELIGPTRAALSSWLPLGQAWHVAAFIARMFERDPLPHRDGHTEEDQK